jgi:thymidine kinase
MIYTHDSVPIPCIKLRVLNTFENDYDIVLINEAQFFYELKKFVIDALSRRKIVYLFGLDGDFKQEVFGEMVELIPMADSYVKLYARCLCGNKASFSKRNNDNNEQYAPHDSYRPACRTCLTFDV